MMNSRLQYIFGTGGRQRVKIFSGQNWKKQEQQQQQQRKVIRTSFNFLSLQSTFFSELHFLWHCLIPPRPNVKNPLSLLCQSSRSQPRATLFLSLKNIRFESRPAWMEGGKRKVRRFFPFPLRRFWCLSIRRITNLIPRGMKQI